jgi:predicted lipase
VFDRNYFKAKYPGFTDDVIEIIVLFEKGIRFKEFKQLFKKGHALHQMAFAEIQRFKEGVSPFDGSQSKTGT